MLLYVDTIKESRILAEMLRLAFARNFGYITATDNGFDEIACAADQYVGKTSKSVECREKLVCGLQ